MSVGTDVNTRRMDIVANLEHEAEAEAEPAQRAKPAKVTVRRDQVYNRRPSDALKRKALQLRLDGWTRKQISEELGIEQSYISNLLYHDSYRDMRLRMGFEK